MADTLTDARVRARIIEWRADPVRFVREVFKAEPDGWQAEVLEMLAGNRQRTAMKACKGPGKSCVEAWAIWWFLSLFPDSKVAATSVTEDNLRDNLWTELALWQRRSPLLERMFTWTKERIVSNERPETWWASARTWSRSASAEQQGQTLAGLHADFILFVLDEAGSIPDPVAKTAEAVLANAVPGSGRVAKILIGGNPELTDGPLWRACTSERELWNVVEVTGDPLDPNRAPRVSKQWAQEMIDKATLGRDDPWVRVNILGLFPEVQSNKLIGPDEVMDAMRRTYNAKDFAWSPKIIGVDVARFGDDRSVIVKRQGLVSFKPVIFRGLDTMELADRVVQEIVEWKPNAVFVDVIGVGAGVVDRLRQLGYRVTGADSASAAADRRFANKRAEMWWEMVEWIRGGAALAPSPEMLADLVAPLYTFNKQGRFQLESKEDMKKRGALSSDVADALAFTHFQPVSAVTEAHQYGFAHGAGKVATEEDPLRV